MASCGTVVGGGGEKVAQDEKSIKSMGRAVIIKQLEIYFHILPPSHI